MEQTIRITRLLMCFPIKLYQWFIRPLCAPRCRFYPSCSDYALLAFTHKGVIQGAVLVVIRLLKCHPWAKGGYDPVFPNKENP
ncbi:MAG: membrane protein insertion efficiency factor YidD [Legionellaceae bacterium]